MKTLFMRGDLMDASQIFAFFSGIFLFLYYFWKNRRAIYLLFALLWWFGFIYSGKYNLYQHFQNPLRVTVNTISLILLTIVLVQSFRNLFKETEL